MRMEMTIGLSSSSSLFLGNPSSKSSRSSFSPVFFPPSKSAFGRKMGWRGGGGNRRSLRSIPFEISPRMGGVVCSVSSAAEASSGIGFWQDFIDLISSYYLLGDFIDLIVFCTFSLTH